MKTKEDVLSVLQNLGFDFCICDPIQEGTWVFQIEKKLDFMQKTSIKCEIDYHFGYMISWHKNLLTVYPEISSQILNKFKNIADDVCKVHRIYIKPPLFVREQKNLSSKQFIIRVNFNIPASKKILKEIAWKFQKEIDTFCKILSNNEFLIDCSLSVDHEALEIERQEVLKKKHYTDECGKLSRKLNIPFINVLLLGPDEDLLERHLLTLQRATGLIAAQEKSEKRLLYYQIFKGNKETKEKALKSLGIEFGKANVMRLDLSILEDAFK